MLGVSSMIKSEMKRSTTEPKVTDIARRQGTLFAEQMADRFWSSDRVPEDVTF